MPYALYHRATVSVSNTSEKFNTDCQRGFVLHVLKNQSSGSSNFRRPRFAASRRTAKYAHKKLPTAPVRTICQLQKIALNETSCWRRLQSNPHMQTYRSLSEVNLGQPFAPLACLLPLVLNALPVNSVEVPHNKNTCLTAGQLG